jgi:predicted ATPase
MIHLRSISLKASHDGQEGFPFTVPVIRTLDRIDFTAPVTFLVGENGSGKSTILEAIACAIGAVTVGSEGVESDDTLQSVRRLGHALKHTWSKRTHRGFFLRAEDFFGYTKQVSRQRAAAAAQIELIDKEYVGRSELAKRLAKSPHAGTVGDIQQRYGDGLDAQSHGESFLKLFQSRVVPDGLYLLDEPEVPLSPLRQLALLTLLKEMVAARCQFIIATHSPILMAFPDARILSCDSCPIEAVRYEDLESVQLVRDFLNAPERYLERL